MPVKLWNRFFFNKAGEGTGGGGGSGAGGGAGSGAGNPGGTSGGAGGSFLTGEGSAPAGSGGAPAAGGQGAGTTGSGAAAGGGQGGGAPAGNFEWPKEWKQHLPAELREEGALKVIHDIPSLVKSFVHAQKQIGADKVVIPGKHATEDDWKAFYQKLGVPADAKEYNMDLGDKHGFQDSFLNAFKENAHKLGILPKQATELLKWYKGFEGQNLQAKTQAEQTAKAEGFNALKQEWGAAFPEKGRMARLAVKELMNADQRKWLDESGMGDNPQMIRFLEKIGSMVLKEDVIRGEGQGGTGALAPAEASKKAREIIGNHAHPYHNPEHPNHKAAVDEVNQLFQWASVKK